MNHITPPLQTAPKTAAPSKPEANGLPKTFWQRLTRSGGTFLILSIAFHILLLVGAGLWVVQSTQVKKKLSFAAASQPAPAAPQPSPEYKVQAAQRNATSAPLAPARISSTSEASKISIPDTPLSTPAFGAVPASISGMAGAGKGSFGMATNGTGKAGASSVSMGSSGNEVSVFGFKGASTLKGMIGNLYDLKQHPDKSPTEADHGNRQAALKIINNFSAKHFDLGVLTPYFKANDEITASRFWIPSMTAAELPKSFGVEKDVTPISLIVHYKARVVPPKEGTYRFVGFGDDFLGVKLDGKVILPFDRRGSRLYCKGENAGSFYEITKKGHAVSDSVTLTKNQVCELEVILSEWPGGLTGFSLLVEREEDMDKYKRNADGLPIIPIFETDISSAIPEYTGTPGRPTLLPERAAQRVAWKVLKD